MGNGRICCELLVDTKAALMLRVPARIPWQGCLRRSLLAALAAVLVLTQAVGLQHRIEHSAAGGWTGGAAHVAPGAEPADSASCDHGAEPVGGTEKHHCAAVDALALGGGPPQSAVPTPALPSAATRVADKPQRCPQTCWFQAFQARAPPALLS